MGNLPTQRIIPGGHLFDFGEIDYAGPIIIEFRCIIFVRLKISLGQSRLSQKLMDRSEQLFFCKIIHISRKALS